MTIGDQKSLRSEKRVTHIDAAVILEDRACVACGYNLRGLPVGGKCPECGRPTAVSSKANRYDHSLVEAPLRWLRQFSFGANTLLAGYSGMLVFYVATVVSGLPAMAIALFCSAAIWGFGVVVVTAPRPVSNSASVSPANEWAGTRAAARVLGLGWAVAALLGVVEFVWTPTGLIDTLLIGLLMISLASGLAGTVVLSVYCSRIADWANEIDLAHGFRASCTILGVGATANVIAVVCPPGGILWGMLIALCFFATVGAVGYFLMKLWAFASMARWSVVNHIHADARDARLRAKAEQAMRAASVMSDPACPPRSATAPQPSTVPNPVRPKFAAERTGLANPAADQFAKDSLETYSLAPDEE